MKQNSEEDQQKLKLVLEKSNVLDTLLLSI